MGAPPMYDDYAYMDEAERTDFEVRQHLYAQRRLAEADTVDTKAAVEKMLARVEPKRAVCVMFVTEGAVEGEKAKRTVCGKPGTRMLKLTGDWTCDEHDPLRHPGPPTTRCCGLEYELCAEHEGPWECTAGLEVHAGPHRFTRLGG